MATRCARAGSADMTVDARPNRVLLASATASSSVVKLLTASTGPKTSFCQIHASFGTSTNTVGGIKNPLAGRPSSSNRTDAWSGASVCIPAAFAPLIEVWILSYCDWHTFDITSHRNCERKHGFCKVERELFRKRILMGCSNPRHGEGGGWMHFTSVSSW